MYDTNMGLGLWVYLYKQSYGCRVVLHCVLALFFLDVEFFR